MSSRRRRLCLKKHRVVDNAWIEGNEAIAVEAINYFEDQFFEDASQRDFSILQCLPKVISEEDNERKK